MTQQEHENEKVNHLAIALGLLAGLVFGLTAAVTGSEPLIRIATAFRPVGTAFVNAIQMVVIPLVMVVVFLAVGRLGDHRKLGKLGGYSLGLVWLSYIPAILLGAFGMKWALHLFEPVRGGCRRCTPSSPGFHGSLLRSNHPHGARCQKGVIRGWGDG